MNEATPYLGDLDLDSVRTRQELVACLNKLHARADKPSLRQLSRWAVSNGRPSLSKSTVSDMLNGHRMPKKAVFVAFLEACGVPEDQHTPWCWAWDRIAAEERLDESSAKAAEKLAALKAAEEKHKHLNQRLEVLKARIEELNAIEDEYRSRLRAYLEMQLQELRRGARRSAPEATDAPKSRDEDTPQLHPAEFERAGLINYVEQLLRELTTARDLVPNGAPRKHAVPNLDGPGPCI